MIAAQAIVLVLRAVDKCDDGAHATHQSQKTHAAVEDDMKHGPTSRRVRCQRGEQKVVDVGRGHAENGDRESDRSDIVEAEDHA